jgi:hypothetical protein
MADKTPATNAPQPLQLTTNDVIGAIQRQVWELDQYLRYVPVEQVDPRVIMYFLHRSADFAVTLPALPGTETDGKEARKAG